MRKKTIPRLVCGFSLVELLIVIAVFTVIIGSMAKFFMSTITGRAKVETHIEAQEQARLAEDHIIYEIRRAKGIVAGSNFGVNLSQNTSFSLGLIMPDSSKSPTTFSVASGIIYIQQGTNAKVALTGNDVAVTNLTFTNLSPATGRSKDILMNMTVNKPDPTGTTALNVNYYLETSTNLEGR